jgi:hypothetical protein
VWPGPGGLEADLGLADQVEAARDADQVFSADGAAGELKGLAETTGRLAHLAAKLRVLIGQLLRRHGLDRVAPRKDDLVGPVLKLHQHAFDVFVAVAAEDDYHRVVRDILADGMNQGKCWRHCGRRRS